MARINIDSKFFSDGRIKLLGMKIRTNRFDARGRLLEIWDYCHEHKTEFIECGLIDPLCEIDGMESALVDSKLAERIEGRIRLRGVIDRIQYLHKDFSAMGKKSAASRCAKLGSSNPRVNSNVNSNVNTCELGSSQNVNIREPSSSSSSSSSSSKELEHTSTSSPGLAVKLDLIWNENCGPLGKVKAMSVKRHRHAKARLAENPDPNYWKDVVRRIATSHFCTGQVKNSPWLASFDWFLKPDTHICVMEGKYDERKPLTDNGSNGYTIIPLEKP